MVFGEGLAVPGELLPDNPSDDTQEREQRKHLLDNLRLEVARVQPKPTSAHRRPRVNLPEELQTASHAFVRRGGYQTSLATPYVGPYRIIDRHHRPLSGACTAGRRRQTARTPPHERRLLQGSDGCSP